jgi:hypothetical protein
LALRTLRLDWPLTETGDGHRWLREHCSLDNLGTLAIVGPMEDHYSDSADPKLASEGFTRLLPKLQSLRLSGYHKHSTVNSMLDRYGAGLRRL